MYIHLNQIIHLTTQAKALEFPSSEYKKTIKICKWQVCFILFPLGEKRKGMHADQLLY